MRLIGTGTNKSGHDVPTLFTWANLVTLCRFLLVPYFSWVILHEHAYMKGFWVLIVLGSTDWIDGFIARRLNQVSTWGRILDPLADRLGLAIITLTLMIEGIAPWWLFPLLVIPDFLLSAYNVIFLKRPQNLTVTYIAKLRTAALFFAVPILVLGATPEFSHTILTPIAKVLIVIGVVGHWIAFVQYMQQSINEYKQSRARLTGKGSEWLR